MEPTWNSVAIGSFVDVVGVILIHGRLSVCKSLPSGRVFRFEGHLLPGFERLSLMKVKVQHSHLGLVLKQEACTRVLQLPELLEGDLFTLLEPCSGVGALGVGASYAGWKTVVVNDRNPTIMTLAGDYTEAQQVVGDISEDETIFKLWQLHPRRSAMAFGFACQPFSRLGDKKEGGDDRSKSLTGGLRAAWLLHCPIVVLECVVDAASSSFVRKEIHRFTTATGFNESDQILDLASFWPCRRKRWWMVLTMGVMGKITLPEMPALDQPPMLGDLMPCPVGISQDLDTHNSGVGNV